MDRMIYVAMTGAKQTMSQQAAVSNNLANANTNGFRSELASFRAVPVQGQAQATRAFVVDSTVGADFAAGSLIQTGRPLDVAVQGSGWIAVQGADGKEGYTRDGNLQVSSTGALTTRQGFPVLGDSGPLTVPAGSQVTVAADGTVSATQDGTPPAVSTVGRMRLVDPATTNLARGDDGLFRTGDGKPVPAAATVKLALGSLETSNVNMAEQMVHMIELARSYDLNTRLITTASDNEKAASQILSLN
jgi:flagellar basal-body rod protein FlgF